MSDNGSGECGLQRAAEVLNAGEKVALLVGQDAEGSGVQRPTAMAKVLFTNAPPTL